MALLLAYETYLNLAPAGHVIEQLYKSAENKNKILLLFFMRGLRKLGLEHWLAVLFPPNGPL